MIIKAEKQENMLLVVKLSVLFVELIFVEDKALILKNTQPIIIIGLVLKRENILMLVLIQ